LSLLTKQFGSDAERLIYIQRAALWNLEASAPIDSGSKSSSRRIERC
jgi:hypothetical protein